MLLSIQIQSVTSTLASSEPILLATPLCTTCWYSQGNMFDIEAKANDVRVTSITMHVYGSGVAEIWTRLGSYEGNEGNQQSDWINLVAGFPFDVGASSQLVEILLPQPVPIAATTRRAFYTTAQAGQYVFYSVGDGTSVAEDDSLIIHEGSFNLYRFGGFNRPRKW